MDKPPPNQPCVTLSRRIAADALMDALHRNRDLDAALAHHIERAPMPPQDKAFARRLAVTTLRHYGVIRGLIAALVQRPLTGRQQRVDAFLAVGIAQLYWMEVPDYAAVSTTVDLAKQEGFNAFSGLVNATLKNAAKRKDAILSDPGIGKANTPAWLWERWRQAYGEETAARIAAAHLPEPPLDLSFTSPEARQGFALHVAGDRGQRLDGDGAAELEVGGAVHRAHAAGADLLIYAVIAQSRADHRLLLRRTGLGMWVEPRFSKRQANVGCGTSLVKQ